MRVYLINPDNPVVSLTKVGGRNKLNKYRVWKPLSLLTLARLTPPRWDVEVIDENLGRVDYDQLPRPDLVGVTAFTSQATRAYQLAGYFRDRGVPVVMGGIHASMCPDEALRYVNSIVTGEGESQWQRVLDDLENGDLRQTYIGGLAPVEEISPARHDMLRGKYFFGSIQTTRGCPLNCTFCSVTAFNGGKFRHRPIDIVIEELRQIRERVILFVDDNLIGTRRDHISYTKELCRAMIRERLTKPWICQATLNLADDEELLYLARKAGCFGVLIGFESPTPEGLIAVHKKLNLRGARNFRESVARIQKHGIVVTGSFIMGIDTDRKGIGEVMARSCDQYGVDAVAMFILTPLPGTQLWGQMEKESRILANNYPEDWQFYTLAHPVAAYKSFSWEDLIEEMKTFNDRFYTYPKIAKRILRMAPRNWKAPHKILLNVITNVTCRSNHMLDRRVYDGRETGPFTVESAPAGFSSEPHRRVET